MISSSLRPAALSACIFVALDVSRLWLESIPEVFIFCTLPACWMALLTEPPAGIPPASHAYKTGARLLSYGGTVSSRILPRLAPLTACLAYAAALLALRHEAAVARNWMLALQAPRIVGFAWALAVAMRWRQKSEGPRVAMPEPLPADLDATPGSLRLKRTPLYSELPLRSTYRPALPPSTAIGIVMALGGGLCAAGGLWPTWGAVRCVAAASWFLSAAIAWRANGARRDRSR